jgi:hypothetical protein
MQLAQPMLLLILLCTMCSCNTFKAPNNASENVKKIFNEANIAAPALLAEVRSYYLNPNASHSCVPFKDFEPDSELVRNLLNYKEYKIRLEDFSESNLSVSFYNKSKKSEFNLHISTNNGKCSAFYFAEVISCEG